MATFPTHHTHEYAYASHSARKFSFTLGKMLNTVHILAVSSVVAIGIRGIEYVTNKRVREEPSQKHLMTVLKYLAMIAAGLFVVSMFVPPNQIRQLGGSTQPELATQLATQAVAPVIPQPTKLPLLEDLQHDMCRAVTPKPVPTIVDP